MWGDSRRRRLSPILLAAAACAAFAPLTSARASGGFVTASGETAPTIAREQVLVVYDPDKQLETIVREIRFVDATKPVALLVPLPSAPTITKVARAPFPELRGYFPFSGPPALPPRPPPPPPKGLAGIGAPQPESPEPALPSLEASQRGSFTFTTFSTGDASARDASFGKDSFAASADVTEWLAHYDRLGFSLAALRYQPPKAPLGEHPETTGDVLAMQFTTAVPILPYREPLHGAKSRSRVLDVWLVTPSPRTPVASVPTKSNDDVAIERPLAEGMHYATSTKLAALERVTNRATCGAPAIRPGDNRLGRGGIAIPPATTSEALTSPATIHAALGASASFLPRAKSYSVQTFRDARATREGLSDVLFVPRVESSADDAWKQSHARFFGVLDPRLETR